MLLAGNCSGLLLQESLLLQVSRLLLVSLLLLASLQPLASLLLLGLNWRPFDDDISAAGSGNVAGALAIADVDGAWSP